jgi:hypothetical protein
MNRSLWISVVMLAASATARAQVDTMWGGGTGDWSDAVRWSEPGYPNNGAKADTPPLMGMPSLKFSRRCVDISSGSAMPWRGQANGARAGEIALSVESTQTLAVPGVRKAGPAVPVPVADGGGCPTGLPRAAEGPGGEVPAGFRLVQKTRYKRRKAHTIVNAMKLELMEQKRRWEAAHPPRPALPPEVFHALSANSQAPSAA